MSQLHLHAEPEDIAPYVLLPGDPNRATYIASTFLEDARLYNDNRQLLGYTGRYRGQPVSIQATGMGCPSLAIVVEELLRLGARTLVRVGTAGIVSESVRPGELIVATGSVPADGTTRHYLRGEPASPQAHYRVVNALVAAEDGEGDVHVGLIRTEDAFYATTAHDLPGFRAQGILAIEMESSALFLLGQLRGAETGCILTASNAIGDSEFAGGDVMKLGVERMVRRALEACLLLESPGNPAMAR